MMTNSKQQFEHARAANDHGEAAVGTLLRRARETAGYQQTEIAAHLGVSRAAVAQWEAGKRQPAAETLSRLHAFLAVPKANPAGAALVTPENASPEERRRASYVFALHRAAAVYADEGLLDIAADTLALADLVAVHWPRGYPNYRIPTAATPPLPIPARGSAASFSGSAAGMCAEEGEE